MGDGAATYKVKVSAPKGSMVVVTPDRLVFGSRNEKKNYIVAITNSHKKRRDMYENKKRACLG